MRWIVNLIKVIAIPVASTYLDVMTQGQKMIFAVAVVVAIADCVSNDLLAIRRIELDGDDLIFRSLWRRRSIPLASLDAIRHPWYDVSRVWIRWDFRGDASITTTTQFASIMRFVADVSALGEDVDVRL